MQAAPEKHTSSEASLQLLLFVDERPSSRKQIQQIQSYLESLKADYPFELQVVEVGEQPYLAEHFKLVATPALIKIHPEPRHTLAGSNLVAQLKNWWPRWQRCLEEYQAQAVQGIPLQPTDGSPGISSITYSAELLKLSDEVFRLKKENEELLEQLNFKDRAIALLAHDLRSPLTAASLALETLELGQVNKSVRSPKLTQALIEQLMKQARTQIRTMERMITDILQAARGTSAELCILPHKLDMGKLCLDILTQMQERFEAKSQRIETDIPKDLPMVYADEERIRQVMVNLLDNAMKYTPDGGTILISILHRTTQKIQVSVRDTGPGIPLENCDRVFEDHYRLKRDEAKEGYGLGLAVCQRIIRAHYGHIWVDSSVNQGSCFHFTLPAYP